MRLYLVGGAVRNHLFKVRQSDLDFAVEAESFEAMKHGLQGRGLVVWQERPEFVTLRGRLPAHAVTDFGGVLTRSPDGTVAADFTLCRAEAMYHDNRHPSVVTPAPLAVDLSRRDFTVNAIAVDEDGVWTDPFDGRGDALEFTLRCVGSPHMRLEEDPVRVLRALRFAVTHDLYIDDDLRAALRTEGVLRSLAAIPHERIREELNKALKVDWLETIMVLGRVMPEVAEALDRFQPKLWLKATSEDR